MAGQSEQNTRAVHMEDEPDIEELRDETAVVVRNHDRDLATKIIFEYVFEKYLTPMLDNYFQFQYMGPCNYYRNNWRGFIMVACFDEPCEGDYHLPGYVYNWYKSTAKLKQHTWNNTFGYDRLSTPSFARIF